MSLPRYIGWHRDPVVAEVYASEGIPLESNLFPLKKVPICYVLRAVGHGIKIGITTNLQKRLEAFKTYSPHPILMVGYLEGGLAIEQQLKRRFSDARIRGEWFGEEILPEIISLLRQEGTCYA